MSGLKTLFGRGLDQDWVDRANGFWSVLLLAVCSVGAFLVRFIKNPIICHTPAHFTSAWVDYGTEACFMNDELYVPQLFPGDQPQEMDHSYHLWIPLILFIQALCFKIPNIIWETVKHHLTLNMEETVDELKQAQLTSRGNRGFVFQDASRLFSSLLNKNKFLLTLLYLFVKLLSCLNLIGQFIFITIYFKNTLLLKAGRHLDFNIEPFIKPLFQKILLCDYQVRVISRVQKYTLQCTLPIVDVYEKLYVFLWYWVFFLTVITVFNLILWVGFLFIPFLRNNRITAYINATPGPSQESSAVTRFVSSCLGVDGVFLLTMISQNSSEMVAANLSQQMYQEFLNQPMQPVPSTSAGEIIEITATNPGFESVPMTTTSHGGGNPEKLPLA